MASLENKISEIEVDMTTQGDDFTKLGDLQKALDETNETLENKMLRWEELSERIEGGA
jgi:ATP-binding cassette subfamily F protein uup